MAWNGIPKVLDLEPTLEPAGKEATKGSDDGRKDGHDDCVQLQAAAWLG